MILVETKTDTTSQPILNDTPQEGESETKFSFSDLLKGFSPSTTEDTAQNTTTPNDTQKSSKSELLSLLKTTDATLPEVEDAEEFNPKVLLSLNNQDLKQLISDAKAYLKDQILQSDSALKAEIKDLPKTLQGLLDIAKKFSIQVDKISLEDVQSKTQLPQAFTKNIEKNLPLETNSLKTTQPKSLELSQVRENLERSSDLTKVVTTQTLKSQKLIKQEPLFKAQTTTEHSTEQVVQFKQLKVDESKPKTKADETLKLLLRGEKSTQKETTLTSDFSVATAKVIAPSAKTETTNTLESLLHGESKETANSSKSEMINLPKAESLEVKLKEAKQMVKYLSSDIKSSIENYKSPFTRVKIQLNPQELGKVDLTIVQRGNNLHLNISSNNSAIQTLAFNANELKTQLQNNGINNATLNFNNSEQSDSSQSQQQHQQQRNQQRASTEYNHYDEEVTNEELYDSLEIVVPYYA